MWNTNVTVSLFMTSLTLLTPCLMQVRIVASLPCYTGENVDDQRGSGVFRRSILALQLLNAAGYGQPGSNLQLDLVYNPNGIFLAPPQAQLQVRAENGGADEGESADATELQLCGLLWG